MQSLAEEGSFFDRIWRLFGEEDARPPPGPDDVRYKVEIEASGAGSDLKTALDDSSNLKALSASPPGNAAGLVRRATDDRTRLIAALYAFGYYGGTVDIRLAGVAVSSPDAIAAVERARRSGPVPIMIAVNPGPLFKFRDIRFEDAESRRSVPAPLSGEALRLQPGAPALATSIPAAEALIATALRKEGYPFAGVASRDVVADHATNSIDVAFRLRRGPKGTFGPVTVQGTEKLDPSFVSERRGFEPGEPYDPEKLAAYRRELVRNDLFDSIRIQEAERLDAEGRLPITVDVKERPRRFIGFGIKYSNTDGAEINGYWGHRNLFGGGERLRIDAAATAFGSKIDNLTDLDNLGYKVSVALSKPGILTVRDDLLTQVTSLREITDAYRRQGTLFAAGIRRRLSERLSIQLGIDFEFANVRDVFGDNDYKLVGFPFELAYDSTNSLLDPSRGIRANLVVAPFPNFGGATVGMVHVKGTVSAYAALDRRARWVVAGRLSSGSITGASIRDLPAHRRFYVGGGGSLRGFDYQSVSPRDSAGRLIGGRSFIEGSLELRVKITDTIGIVPFVDAGTAYSASFPDFSETMRVSAGLGVRYYTSIGPVRADVAIPINRREGDSRFGIYVGLGQSF